LASLLQGCGSRSGVRQTVQQTARWQRASSGNTGFLGCDIELAQCRECELV
jgi:hypothetical protein